jgi:hypothetical protein
MYFSGNAWPSATENVKYLLGWTARRATSSSCRARLLPKHIYNGLFFLCSTQTTEPSIVNLPLQSFHFCPYEFGNETSFE